MRSSISICLLVLWVFPASGASLKEARTRQLKGNYEEAQSDYEAILGDGKDIGPASLGLSKALASQGEYDKAMAAVESALKKLPKDADLLARQAELLHFRGRYDEAMKAADAALAVKDKHLLARWVRAQVFRDRGNTKDADAEVKRILRVYGDVVNTADEIKSPEDLVVVGLASAENARWNGLADEFQAILEDLYGDAVKFDKDFWPGEYQAGMLLLEKYNRGEALDAFDKALKINPSSSEALAARGVSALQLMEIKDAERFAERALKFNPHLPKALRLRADVYLAIGDYPKALKELERARKVNPRDERTLGRVAACYQFTNDKKAYEAVVAEVEKVTKKPAQFWFEFGERADERRRYDLAEAAYKKAVALRPELAGPKNNLGLLYARLGKEAESKEMLDKGFAIDRFNVRVSNMRKVLDHVAKYKTLKSKHFILRYDSKADPALGPYVSEFLEEIYEQMAKRFDYRPEGPFTVEIFTSHEMFSGRTIGLPDLHTIGACTGRVVALVSPNEKTKKGDPARKPFNWSRVLRHEVVHLFNLAQTNYLVPHWVTEGLAVTNEGFPRPPSWNKMLAEKVASNKLLNLDTIDLGFIRPRDALEWQQAYLQASLYIEYIEKTFGGEGKKPVGVMLAAFAEGKSAVEAISIACKVDKATFEKGYRAYLDQVVKETSGKRAAEKQRTLAELRAEYKKDPKDADVCAALALRLVGKQRAEARKLAEEAVDIKKNHPKALYVLSLLAQRAADAKLERSLLEKALEKENPEPLVLKALGKLYYDASDFKEAAEMFELGRKADPSDREWLEELARVYAQTNDTKKQISVLRDLIPQDADDLDRRIRLSRLLSEQGLNAESEKYARQALEVDITSKEARKLLFESLKDQKKDAEAKRMKGLLGE
jgi:cellulose synthase operon protein C